ncbi:MAG TPA: hypothetical protein VGX70_01470 [Gemmataceae bacterium]|jgi:hypothetical protein|nr:hypothetical protein [Gemmataceae bacterium]
MHLATCPTCGTTVALDFIPTAGLVWCHTCEKGFSPSGMLAPESENAEDSNGEFDADANGRG